MVQDNFQDDSFVGFFPQKKKDFLHQQHRLRLVKKKKTTFAQRKTGGTGTVGLGGMNLSNPAVPSEDLFLAVAQFRGDAQFQLVDALSQVLHLGEGQDKFLFPKFHPGDLRRFAGIRYDGQ